MLRFRGEEMWVGKQFIGFPRAVDDERPFIIEGTDHQFLHSSETREMAQLWITVHASEMIARAVLLP